MKFLGNIVQMLGAIPIPTTTKAMPNFLDSINKTEVKEESISERINSINK